MHRSVSLPWRVTVLLTCLLHFAHCGGSGPTAGRIHTLRLPEPPARRAPASRPVIGVEIFSAAGAVNDWRLLRYETPTQLTYYPEDRWVSEPASMIPEVAARLLEQMGIARQASLLPWVETMDYVLQGQILSFEEIAFGEPRKVRVALELALVRFPRREPVWNGTFRAERPVAGQGVGGVVEALSLATHEVLKSGFEEMARHLQESN